MGSTLGYRPVCGPSCRVGSGRLAGELVLSFLVAVQNQAVQKAAWFSTIIAVLLGVIGFFPNIIDGFFVGGIVLVEVDWRSSA